VAVAVVGTGVIVWNALAGLRVADEFGRGPFVLQSQQAQQVSDCFNAVVRATVPDGARLHLDIADAGFEQRLTEGPYPHAIVVAPEQPADYLVYVALGATEEFPPCPGYTVTITPVSDSG
jgi:hypothetical protein